jgi:hypothetical protein
MLLAASMRCRRPRYKLPVSTDPPRAPLPKGGALILPCLLTENWRLAQRQIGRGAFVAPLVRRCSVTAMCAGSACCSPQEPRTEKWRSLLTAIVRARGS